MKEKKTGKRRKEGRGETSREKRRREKKKGGGGNALAGERMGPYDIDKRLNQCKTSNSGTMRCINSTLLYTMHAVQVFRRRMFVLVDRC